MKRCLLILLLPTIAFADIERVNEETRLPYWPDYILSGDPNDLDRYFQILLKELQDITDEVVRAVNLGIDLDDTDIRYFGTKDINGNYSNGDWRLIKVAADDFELQKMIASTWTQESKWSVADGFEFLDELRDSSSSFLIDAGTITGAIAITASAIITGGTLTDGTFTTTGGVTSTGSLALTTDLAVQYGGTGASTFTDGGVLLGSGTSAITAMAVLTDGQFIVGDGTTDPVAESGNTARTSLGLGTGDSPTFTGLTTTAGRIADTARYTTTQTLDADDHIVYCDTDGAAWTLTLPAGVNGTHYKIINCGSSGNDLTVDPDGTEQIWGNGAGTAFVMIDGDILNIHFETTEHWW